MKTTSNTLKALLFGVLFLAGSQIMAQTTTNPDTVCAGAISEAYLVTPTAGSTYNWTITGGGGVQNPITITSNITVDWGAISGLYANAVSVTETDANGCLGTPIVLDVYILDLQFPQIGPFCLGDPVANFGGTPGTGTYTDASGTVITDFDPTLFGAGSHLITYSLGGCSTTMTAVVNPGPITGPIQHF